MWTLARIANEVWPAGKKPEIGGADACRETLLLSYTVNGVAEFAVAMQLSCQPSRKTFYTPFVWRANGISQVALATNRCLASKMDGPCSALRSNGF